MRHLYRLPLILFVFFLGIFVLPSCESDDDPGITEDGKLLASTEIALRDPTSARVFAQSVGLDTLNDSLQYNVDVYIITYRTLYKNKTTTASGIVCIPRKDKPMDLISFQHGTIASHDEAPSVDNGIGGSSFGNLQFLGCLGAVWIFPDQIGFGSSTQFPHPYYVKNPSAQAVIDMIIAARELVLEKQKLLSGRLFLAGYSQGGYLTLAAHRQMEVNNQVPFGFNLTGSFPASGGYLIKEVQEYFFSLTTYSQPFYMAYVANAFTEHYEWNQPLSIYFQEPYASNIPALFDGSKTGGEINAALTDTVANLLQPGFLTNIDTDPQFQNLRTAMSENSLVDFVPQISVQLFHGDQDVTVPYNSSVVAQQEFANLGATKVSLTTIPGANHSTGFIPYLSDILSRMGFY